MSTRSLEALTLILCGLALQVVALPLSHVAPHPELLSMSGFAAIAAGAVKLCGRR